MRWRWVGRTVWFAYVVVALWLTIVNLPTHFTNPILFPGVGAPQSALLRTGLHDLGIDPRVYAIYRTILDQLAGLVAFVVAVSLVRRKSSEPVVLLVATFLITSMCMTDPPSLIALEATHPTQAFLGKVVLISQMTLFAALFYVFPDGRFFPRWGIVPVAVWFIALVGIMFFPGSAIDSWDWAPLPTLIGFTALFGPGIYAQINRYVRSSGTLERQQTKWAIGGLIIAVTSFALLNVWLAAQENRLSEDSPVRAVAADFLFNTAFTLAFAAVPVTLAIAIFKYHLFAIDILINRALVYGGLTAIVIGIYALIIAGIGTLLSTNHPFVISFVATGVVAVVFQPLREGLQRKVNRLLYGERDEPYAVISRLGRQLEETLPADAILPTIVETVATALKLPYAAIALGSGLEPPIVAATGSPVADPMRLPLSYQGELVGELLLASRAPGETFSSRDRRLLSDLARQAGVAARAVRLADETRQLAVDLQSARERLVTAREEERRRLRRDLHDGLGPRLAALTLRLEAARDLLASDARADALLEDLATRTEEAVTDVRRLVYALRPAPLDQYGLVGALRQAADGYGPAEMEIAVEIPAGDEAAMARLPAAVEVAAFRIALEALTNAVRHAQASHCTISLAFSDEQTLVLEVVDDGQGKAFTRDAGVGLGSMRERAEELGGSFSITSTDSGTRVCAQLPCHALAADVQEALQ